MIRFKNVEQREVVRFLAVNHEKGTALSFKTKKER